MSKKIQPEHKTDHLMLLMGTNPLPNYVAAKLLAKPDTQLHLVVTDEIQAMGIPIRLLKQLEKDPSDQDYYISVKATDPSDIFSKVCERVTKKPGSWGLHYTGGKKVMATHAYRAMEHALAKSGPDIQGIYSYLDADSLEMVIKQSGKPVQYCSSELDSPVMLWQLLDLHGKPETTIKKARWETYPTGAFENRALGKKPQRVPFYPDLCEQLKNAQITDDHSPFEELRNSILPLSQRTGQKEQDLQMWLSENIWFEHYVLGQIIRVKDECHISDYVLGFEAQIFGGAKEFESDILAIQGHQLFYITITTAKKEKENKLKFFEAYIRAQQLGGEQAKVALVTLSPHVNAQSMENELRSDLHLTGKVFDRNHLQDTINFHEELKNWMR